MLLKMKTKRHEAFSAAWLFSFLPLKTIQASISIGLEMTRLLIPVLTGKLIDSFSHNHQASWSLAIIVVISECVVIILTFCKDIVEQKAFAAFENRLSISYWNMIRTMPIQVFITTPTGTWMQKLSYDVRTLSMSFRQIVGNVFGILLFFCVSTAMLAKTSWQTAPILLCLVVLALIVYCLYKQRVLDASAETRKSYYDMGNAFNELLLMHPFLKVCNKDADYAQHFNRSVEQTTQREYLLSKTLSQSQFLLDVVFWGVQGAILVMCVYFILEGKMSVGILVAFMALLNQILRRISSLMQLLPHIARGVEALNAIRETADRCGREDKLPFMMCKNFAPEVVVDCRHVYFTYQEVEVIKDFTAELKYNDFCVLIGRNGSGKSTLSKLLVGILQPSKGIVALRNYALVGWVPQELEIFKDSVLENIRLNDKSIPQQAVADVVRQCGLDDWIRKLPNGINSLVSHDVISGGQLQLLSIARALIRNPDLLVVDEVSNNLDIVMKQKIYETLRKCSKGRTVVLVSHDIESMRLANRIFFFGGNGVIELPKGTTEDEIVKLLNQET